MRKTGLILGGVGSGLAFLSAIAMLIFAYALEGVVGWGPTSLLPRFAQASGDSAILGAIGLLQLAFASLGIFATVYGRRNLKVGGYLLIVAGILLAFPHGVAGVETLLLAAGGILLLFAKRRQK